jgi:hypothetical protein
MRLTHLVRADAADFWLALLLALLPTQMASAPDSTHTLSPLIDV